ncbi:MAG: HAD family hydrolase [Gammaproteobacteria bacterium]|nr:HAD family hydrolase [Gammaproteobacteria bacterium]
MIFFDIDDTLLDHQKAVKNALTHFNLFGRGKSRPVPTIFNKYFNLWIQLSEKYYALYLSHQLTFQEQRRLRVQEFFLNFNIKLSNKEADEQFERFLHSYEKGWQAFDDVMPCLNQLKSLKFRLGIISNGNESQQYKKLEKLKLLDYFNPIVISEDLGVSKPDPRIFQEAAKCAQKPINECIYIGDRLESDAVGSVAAGMRGIWLNREGKKNNNNTVVIIKTLDELVQSISKNQSL